MAYKYNPGFLSDQASIDSFVVRHKDLRIVLDIVAENSRASSNRHVLIMGPRGSGKSTLARRVVAELHTNPTFKERWYPIVLGEESYTITSAGEFWLECVFHLASQLERADLKEQFKEMQAEKDDVRLRETALGILVSHANEISKKILLIVENLNMILEDQMTDQEGWEIRHALHNVPEVMLLTTATRKFDQIQNADQALFQQFKIHELRPLSLSEVTTLWSSLTREKLRIRKTRPIQILTGGSPRLITILGEFAVGHSFVSLMAKLTSLIDQYTDYFKSQLDALPPAERKVFVTLLEKWDPATTRDIANEARMAVNQVSAHLSRLKSRGAVQRRAGGQYWEASERLFNLYYLMRRRGAPSTRVYALVKFMTVYYETEQLYERATDLAKECGTLDPQSRQDHYTALAEIMSRFDATKQAHLLSLTPPDFAKQLEHSTSDSGPRVDSRRRHGRPSVHQRILDLIKENRVANAVRILHQANLFQKQDAPIWALVGYSVGVRDRDYEKAESLLKKAEDLDSQLGHIWYYRGLMLRSQRQYRDAIDAFRSAIDKGLDNADVRVELADAQEELSDFESAEQSFRAATGMDANSAYAWYSLGTFLMRRGKDSLDAERAFKRALEIAPDDVRYMGALAAFTLDERSDPATAEKLFRSILKRQPGNTRAWVSLIRSLAISRRPKEEMEAEYTAAMASVDPKNKWRIGFAFAQYLNQVHKHERAEEIFREATITSPRNGFAWLNLARQLASSPGKAEEAAKAFDTALEIIPKNPELWTAYGAYLDNRSDRQTEAEAALRKATEIAPTDCTPWKVLGDHFVKAEKYEESSKCYRRAIAENPKCVCALDAYVETVAKSRESLTEIRQMIEGFMKRLPGSPEPHIALSKFYLSTANDKEAAFEQLIVALNKGALTRNLIDTLIITLDLQDDLSSVRKIERFVVTGDGKTDSSRDIVAWRIYRTGVTNALIEAAVSLAKDVVAHSAEEWTYRHTLSAVLFRSGRQQESLEQLQWLMDHVDTDTFSDFVEFCIDLAKQGMAKELLATLLNSNSREEFEPLIVALQLDEGEEPNVAREVLEVAQDIRKSIYEGKNIPINA